MCKKQIAGVAYASKKKHGYLCEPCWEKDVDVDDEV
jgi:hypothetical protein